MSDSSGSMCPSAPCRPGAILLGIVQADGQVALAAERIVVDAEFVRIAHEGRPPEKRFRFAQSCIKSACRQWAGSQCGLIDQILEVVQPDLPLELPACSIRVNCRWFAQSGASACAVCPEIVTNVASSLQVSEP